MRNLYDWIPLRSKAAQAKRTRDKLNADSLELQRERQAHYRAVTQSDAGGKDTR